MQEQQQKFHGKALFSGTMPEQQRDTALHRYPQRVARPDTDVSFKLEFRKARKRWGTLPRPQPLNRRTQSAPFARE
jgi:hypothetical protein